MKLLNRFRDGFAYRRINSDSWISTPAVAAVIALGTVAIGGVIAVWPQEISAATRSFVLGPRGRIEGWVVAFWISTLVWAGFLYERLKVDDRTQKERLLELASAALNAPNAQVIKNYSAYYQLIADAIRDTHLPTASEEERIRALESGIKTVLTVLAGLASEFSRASLNSSFGANVMLVARPQAGPSTPFEASLLDRIRFYDKDGGNPASLRAILYLPSALLISNISDRPLRHIPLIALPVPPEPRGKHGHRLALPGAPWALLTGEQSVQEDTHAMADECKDFAAQTLDEIRQYFAAGDGASIRSFVSFRIGDSEAPVGVLNIDSDHTHVLGPEREYYTTFHSLITPVLHLLKKPVIEYAALTAKHSDP